MSTLPQPPDEAWEHYERAMNVEVEDDDSSALTEKAGELALAIKKANGVFPAAHAMLGLAMLQLGNEKRARQEFNVAIQQETFNTLARACLIMMDIDNLGAKETVRTGGWFDLLIVGGELTAAKARINSLSRKIDELVQAYPKDIRESSNVDYWIGMSELMLSVHDEIQGIQALPRKERLSRAVLDAPWELTGIPPEYEEQVSNLKRRAEGRVLLCQ